MKVYFAARYSRREEIKALAEQLPPGITCNSSWLSGHQNLTRGEIGEVDFWDVTNANVLVMFTDEGSTHNGKLVEFGIALGYRKPIILVGPHMQTHFHMLPWVRRCNTFWEAVGMLKELQEFNRRFTSGRASSEV